MKGGGGVNVQGAFKECHRDKNETTFSAPRFCRPSSEKKKRGARGSHRIKCTDIMFAAVPDSVALSFAVESEGWHLE